MLETTYQLVEPPAPALSWEEYEPLALGELAAALARPDVSEPDLQVLLEEHPGLVPANYPVMDVGHNGVYPGAVIAQPVLTGLASKRPDFCSISFHSGTLYATLVEIESPDKRWSTRSGQPTSELTQATQQLRDWRIWFRAPGNAQRFLLEYRVPPDLLLGRDFEQRYVLVYGRRSDLESSGFQRKRNALKHEDEEFMTWDRLRPNPYLPNLLTTNLTPAGYVARFVAPTAQLGPHDTEYWSTILGKGEAALRSRLIPESRREFLAARWPYWDSWEANRHKHKPSFTRLLDGE